jgi:protein-disulfide isomerase
VTIHVFSDFQCPYCRQAELTLLELERLYPGKLRVVWHDRPLDFHPLALPAARAGREANRQGGLAVFWKFHARMFGIEQAAAEVSRPELLAHAKALGLDVPAMEKAIDSNARDAAIEQDIELATSLGFRGTPAFVIGRYALTGARALRHFQRLVELSLAEQTAAPDHQGPPRQ